MHEFPYQANTREGRVTINDEADLIELFKSFLDLSGEAFYSLVKQSICPNRLRDAWATGMVERYFYCTTHNVPPYQGDYDDQPRVWVDVSKYIYQVRTEITNCKCSIHGK